MIVLKAIYNKAEECATSTLFPLYA